MTSFVHFYEQSKVPMGFESAKKYNSGPGELDSVPKILQSNLEQKLVPLLQDDFFAV